MRWLILAFLLNCHTGIAGINIPLQQNMEPPSLLTETGLFVGPIADLQPSSELRPYQVNQSLWTDFADKQRWIYLPAGQMVGFDATEFWRFPVGTILVKHFRMEISKQRYQNI